MNSAMVSLNRLWMSSMLPIPAIRHRGCLYVRLEVLTEQLRRVSQRPSLDPKTISAALRSAGMLETDASGKNTKKLDGRRYLVIRCRQ